MSDLLLHKSIQYQTIFVGVIMEPIFNIKTSNTKNKTIKDSQMTIFHSIIRNLIRNLS